MIVQHGTDFWFRTTASYVALLCDHCETPTQSSQNNIVNAERRGKRQVLIRPSSKVIVKFLSVMQRHGELCASLARIVVPLYRPTRSAAFTLRLISAWSASRSGNNYDLETEPLFIYTFASF